MNIKGIRSILEVGVSVPLSDPGPKKEDACFLSKHSFSSQKEWIKGAQRWLAPINIRLTSAAEGSYTSVGAGFTPNTAGSHPGLALHGAGDSPPRLLPPLFHWAILAPFIEYLIHSVGEGFAGFCQLWSALCFRLPVNCP